VLKQVLKDIFTRTPAAREPHVIGAPTAEDADVMRELASLARDISISLRYVADRIYCMNAINAMRLGDFELERHPRYGDRRRLLRYGFQVSSQNAEDGMIHEIFHRIGPRSRIFAEVGVGDGSECNTAFLLSQGWTGFWIDSNEAFLRTLKDRSDLPDGCVKYLVSHVSRENIAKLFLELGVPTEFDLLSLDIDQNTYYAWEGLKEFRPRVLVIEYNAAIPPDIDWKVHYDPMRMWDGSQNFGASLRALEILGSRLGYSLVGCDLTGINAFFVRTDLVADHFAAPLTSDNHYEPQRYQLTHRRGHRPAILDRMTIGPRDGGTT
jgi:hypothetical protein